MINSAWFILFGLLIIFAIARTCKSTKIFWVLLISLSAGFVGGSMLSKLFSKDTHAKKMSCISTSVKSTQSSCVKFLSFAQDSQSGSVSKKKRKRCIQLSSKIPEGSLQTFNPDIDIGLICNTS